MIGNSGNNTLAGLGGADALDGDAGTDTATYAASVAGVNVSLATGLGSGGDAEGDTLVNIENLTGSGQNDTLEGNGGNNVLAGGSGNDTVSYAHAAAAVTVNLAQTRRRNDRRRHRYVDRVREPDRIRIRRHAHRETASPIS